MELPIEHPLSTLEWTRSGSIKEAVSPLFVTLPCAELASNVRLKTTETNEAHKTFVRTDALR